MNLHEYQGKQLLQEFGIAVPTGHVADTAAAALESAGVIGGDAWYVKAQVLAGSRAAGHFAHAPGSEGGVRLCRTLESVRNNAADMLGEVLFTMQTSSSGATVHQVYVERQAEVRDEFYIAICVNDCGVLCLLISKCGGQHLEHAAAADSSTVTTWPVGGDHQLDENTANAAAASLGLDGDTKQRCIEVFQKLLRLFHEKDCVLIEINPMAVDNSGHFCALDATVKVDDNALFRQPEISQLRDTRNLTKEEVDALEYGFNYFKLDGDIGCVTSGAGMAMATIDTIKHYGGSPANFLDVPPTAEVRQFVEGLRIVLSDASVKVALVNIFGGGILRCNEVADAILLALAETRFNQSVVVRLAGAGAESGRERLKASGLAIDLVSEMDQAAKQAVGITSGNLPQTKKVQKTGTWDLSSWGDFTARLFAKLSGRQFSDRDS